MKNRILNSQIKLTYFGNYTAQILEFLGLYTSIIGAYEHDNLKVVSGLGSLFIGKWIYNYSRMLRSDLRKKSFIPVETSRANLESVVNNN